MSEKEAKMSSSIPGPEIWTTFKALILHVCITVSGPWGHPHFWLPLPRPLWLPPTCLHPRIPCQPPGALSPCPSDAPAAHSPARLRVPQAGPTTSLCLHPHRVTQCLGLGLSWVPWCLTSCSVLPFLMGRHQPLQGPDSQVAFAGIQPAPFWGLFSWCFLRYVNIFELTKNILIYYSIISSSFTLLLGCFVKL